MMGRLLTLVRHHPRLAVATLIALLVAGGVWWNRDTPAPPETPGRAEPKVSERLLSPEVELRGVMRTLQEENALLRKQLEGLAAELQDVKRTLKAPAPEGTPPPGGLKAFREALDRPPAAAPVPEPGPSSAARLAAPAPPPRVTIFKSDMPARAPVTPGPPTGPPPRWLHLPAGSVVSVTMLSGVYAPVRQTNPLPVLLHLDEAPLGPNASRLPLHGCFAIARAVGDDLSERATLQLDSLSCVLPDGRAVSRPLAGWVSGDDGVLGIKGTLIEKQAPFLARVALSGFLQGVASALAQVQTTVTQNPLGGITTQVTGNATQYAALSGLSQTASRMAAFYEGQLQRLVPAIFVASGRQGHAVVQTGLTIEGYPVSALAHGGSPWRTLD